MKLQVLHRLRKAVTIREQSRIYHSAIIAPFIWYLVGSIIIMGADLYGNSKHPAWFFEYQTAIVKAHYLWSKINNVLCMLAICALYKPFQPYYSLISLYTIASLCYEIITIFPITETWDGITTLILFLILACLVAYLSFKDLIKEKRRWKN